MKNCVNCGKEVSIENRYCPYCGCELSPKNISEQQSKEENKKGTIICIISIILASCCYLMFQYNLELKSGSPFLTILPYILALAAFILVIIAKVKHPKHTLATALVWVYGIFAIQAIIIVLIFILIGDACSSCPG